MRIFLCKGDVSVLFFSSFITGAFLKHERGLLEGVWISESGLLAILIVTWEEKLFPRTKQFYCIPGSCVKQGSICSTALPLSMVLPVAHQYKQLNKEASVFNDKVVFKIQDTCKKGFIIICTFVKVYFLKYSFEW